MEIKQRSIWFVNNFWVINKDLSVLILDCLIAFL